MKAYKLQDLFLAFLLSMGLVSSTSWAQVGVSTTEEIDSVNYTDNNTAMKLLEAFGGGCPQNGKYSQVGIQQASQLVEILSAVREDPSCGPYAVGLSANALNIRLQIEALQVSEKEQEYLALKAEQKALAMALEQNSSQLSTDLLQTQLIYNQQQTARYESLVDTERKNQLYNRRIDALTSMVNSTDAMVRQSAGNQYCLKKYMAVTQGVTALATLVGSIAATSAYSLPIAAAAEFTRTIIDLVQKWRIDNAISKVNSGIAQTAYNCALHSLSQNWCSARDATTILKFKSQIWDRNQEHPLVEGLTILDHDLPEILNWLEKVRAGTVPANDATAQMQKRAFDRENKLRTTKVLIAGRIGEAEKRYNQMEESNLEAKWVELRSAIRDIVNIIYFGITADATNPIMDVMSDSSLFAYYLIGLESPGIPKENGMPMDISRYNPFTDPVKPDARFLSLDYTRQRIKELVDQAEGLVQRELREVLNVDPVSLLSDCSLEINGRSCRKSLYTILIFLGKHYPDEYKVGSEALAYAETVNLLQSILNIIETGLKANNVGEVAVAIKDVYDSTKLDFGTTYVKGKVQRIVRISLNSIAQDPKLDWQLRAKLLASHDLIKEIRLTDSEAGADEIYEDIVNAQSMNQDQINNFYKMFGDNIADTLKKLKKAAQKSQEKDALTGPNLRAMASLCIRLLSVTERTKKVEKLCSGVQLESILPGGPKTVSWDRSLFSQPLENRMCIYHDWLRDSAIYEKFCEHDDTCKNLRSGSNIILGEGF